MNNVLTIKNGMQ